MKKYILDTSVLTRFLVHQVERDLAQEVIKRACLKEFQLLAPSLIHFELNNVFVVRQVPQREVERGMEIFFQLIDEGIIQIINPSKDLLFRTREIANISGLKEGYISSYDATFHALALQENAVFLTADKKHYQKTKDSIGSIILLKDMFS